MMETNPGSTSAPQPDDNARGVTYEPLVPAEKVLIAGSLVLGALLLGILLWLSSRYFTVS